MAKRRRQDKDLCDPLLETAARLRSAARVATRQADQMQTAWRAVDGAKRRYERELRRLFKPAQFKRYQELRTAARRAKARISASTRSQADFGKLAEHRARVHRQMAELLDRAGVPARSLQACKRALVRDMSAALSRTARPGVSIAEGGD